MSKIGVVVVDDELVVVNEIGRTLRSLGCAVWTATDAITAVELVARNPVDVVLTGIRMPDIDGFVLIRFLQKHHRHVRLIAMSAHSEDQPALAAAVGTQNVLMKPLSLQLLREALGAVAQEPSPSPETTLMVTLQHPSQTQQSPL